MFIKPIIDWILPNRKYNDLLTVSRFVVYFLSRRGKTNNRTFDAETLDDEDYIFMHCTGAWCNCPETIHKKCAKNLCNGKCKNQYMRETVGAILFPELYKRYNQKQK